MEGININSLDSTDIIPEKGHYETIKEYYKEVPTYDFYGNQTGIERMVMGRDVEWVPSDPEELKNMLRAKREPLLNAFDKWEKAVLRGREVEDYTIMAWYKDLLDLKENAFENIPEKIKYYL